MLTVERNLRTRIEPAVEIAIVQVAVEIGLNYDPAKLKTIIMRILEVQPYSTAKYYLNPSAMLNLVKQHNRP